MQISFFILPPNPPNGGLCILQAQNKGSLKSICSELLVLRHPSLCWGRDGDGVIRVFAVIQRQTPYVDLLKLAGLEISKHELSAFFRKPGQNQYRECKDQVLRNFLSGMGMKYREKKE